MDKPPLPRIEDADKTFIFKEGGVGRKTVAHKDFNTMVGIGLHEYEMAERKGDLLSFAGFHFRKWQNSFFLYHSRKKAEKIPTKLFKISAELDNMMP